MAMGKPLAVKKTIAILTVITAMFTVACETDEDPGTDLGDVDVTEPAGDLGNGDTGDDLGGDTGDDLGGDTTTTTMAGG